MSRLYISVPLESLRMNSVLDFDLYLKQNDEEILYRRANLPFGEEEKGKLLESKVKEMFIQTIDKKAYSRYIEDNLEYIVADENINTDKKAELVYDSAKELIISVLDDPRSGDNIKRSGKLISNTMDLILSDKSAFQSLINVTSYDYYTYTHSVNVGFFAVALANKLGVYKREEICSLGWGAILHDVGKTKICAAIINKDGRLSKEEFEEIKQHPDYGVQILRETNILPEESYKSVHEHHERADGSGYPRGLTLVKISEFGRITAVADVFDALTTKRSYKPAMESFNALNIMKQMEGHFDPDIFEKFVLLMGEQ